MTQSLHKYIRTTPRKLRLVADMVRGLSATRALEYLKHTDKAAALPLSKAVRSALAGAKQKGENVEGLLLKTIMVDSGPIIKRFRAVSRGSAHNIQKKTSHIKVILERKDGPKS